MSFEISLYYQVEPNEKAFVYDDNMTSNVYAMAKEAGILSVINGESNDKAVTEIVDTIKSGYADMLSRPDVYEAIEGANNWGTYDQFLLFVADLLRACAKYPNSRLLIQ